MRVEVMEELCISCGACISLCPEVFEWGNDDKAVAKSPDVSQGQETQAHEAVESCPTAAIKEE